MNRIFAGRMPVVIAAAMIVALASVAYALGTWTTLAPIPEARHNPCAGGVGNVLVVAYGYTGAAGSTTTFLYNHAKNAWSAGPAAPGPLRYFQADGETSHGGKVYCIGGFPAGGNSLTAFDTGTGAWSELAPFPGPARAAAAAAVVGNAIYVFGGIYGSNCFSALDSALRYDIDTNTWSSIASMSDGRALFSAAAVGGKIYVFGGCIPSGTLTDDVDVYDVATNTWSDAPADMLFPRYDHAVSRVGDRVYIIGGEVLPVGDITGTTHVYDAVNDTWAVETDMGVPRGGHSAYSHAGGIIVPGGQTWTTANEFFKP